MSEESGTSTGHDSYDLHDVPRQHKESKKWTKDGTAVHVGGTQTPMSGRMSRMDMDLELANYFVGPRDMDAHSKLPYFLRLHGSVMPRMIVPLINVTIWSTLITCISVWVYELSVNAVLLTVLGFVVGLALSFRSTTAYERYSDGRKAWSLLSVQGRNLARYIWVHVQEREGYEKEDLLQKITAINMILAFAVALKHKLRYEPYAHYPDLHSLVAHLDTFAKAAHKPEHLEAPRISWYKRVGEYLGMSMANSNPRKAIKRADRPLGNLPLEILTYLSAYIQTASTNGSLTSAIMQGQIMTSIAILTDTQASAERVLTTPLPVGYNILISQIVLLYVYMLPFQLFATLKWITIPGTIAAAYIIIGLHSIGNELENPFGNDVNDLPLDHYCEELAAELDVMMSVPAPTSHEYTDNKVLWPLSEDSLADWMGRDIEEIRKTLRSKVVIGTAGKPPPGSSGGETL